MNTERINLAADDCAAVVLLNALCGQHEPGSLEFTKITAAHRASPDRKLAVTFTVEGVTVPLIPILEQMFKVRSEEIDRMAGERALKMVTEAALTPITETLEQANWKIREVLQIVGAKFSEE